MKKLRYLQQPAIPEAARRPTPLRVSVFDDWTKTADHASSSIITIAAEKGLQALTAGALPAKILETPPQSHKRSTKPHLESADDTVAKLFTAIENSELPLLFLVDTNLLMQVLLLLDSALSGTLITLGTSAETQEKLLRSTQEDGRDDSSTPEAEWLERTVFFAATEISPIATRSRDFHLYQIAELREFGLGETLERVLGRALTSHPSGIWLHVSTDSLARIDEQPSSQTITIDELDTVLQKIIATHHLLGISLDSTENQSTKDSTLVLALKAVNRALEAGNPTRQLLHAQDFADRLSALQAKQIQLQHTLRAKHQAEQKKTKEISRPHDNPVPKELSSEEKIGLPKRAQLALLAATLFGVFLLVDLGLLFPSVNLPVRIFRKKPIPYGQTSPTPENIIPKQPENAPLN